MTEEGSQQDKQPKDSGEALGGLSAMVKDLSKKVKDQEEELRIANQRIADYESKESEKTEKPPAEVKKEPAAPEYDEPKPLEEKLSSAGKPDEETAPVKTKVEGVVEFYGAHDRNEDYYGIIKSPDGESYFVFQSCLEEGVELKSGYHVRFDSFVTKKKELAAENVEIVSTKATKAPEPEKPEEKQPERLEGKVKFYGKEDKKKKKWGIITGPEKEYFVHEFNLEQGIALEEGTDVEFEPVEIRCGKHYVAKNIKVIPKPEMQWTLKERLEPFYQAGLRAFLNKDYDSAAEHLDNLFEVFDKDNLDYRTAKVEGIDARGAMYGLGVSLIESGNILLGIVKLRRCLEIEGDVPKKMAADIHYRIGMAYKYFDEKDKRVPEALKKAASYGHELAAKELKRAE